MHLLSTLTLVSSLATGILAQSLGTFDTFSDYECSQGGAGITVPEGNTGGPLQPGVLSVRSNLDAGAEGCTRKFLSHQSLSLSWGPHGKRVNVLACPVIIFQVGGAPPLNIPAGDASCHPLITEGLNWYVFCDQ